MYETVLRTRKHYDVTRTSFSLGCGFNAVVITQGNMDDTTFVRRHRAKLYSLMLLIRARCSRTRQGFDLLTLTVLISLDIDDHGIPEPEDTRRNGRHDELQRIERLPMTTDENRKIISCDIENKLAFIAFVFIDHDFADIEILQNALKSIDCRIGYMVELFLGQVRNINLHGSRLIIFFHDDIRQFDVLGSMFFNQVFICHDDSSLTKILRGCLKNV